MAREWEADASGGSGVDEEVDERAALLAADGHDGQQALDEAAALVWT